MPPIRSLTGYQSPLDHAFKANSPGGLWSLSSLMTFVERHIQLYDLLLRLGFIFVRLNARK